MIPAGIAEAPYRPYRRWIEGAQLSIEANTPETPSQGVYYVFEAGVVFFSSADLAEAEEVFDRLRLNHWEGLLISGDPEQRLEAARGLVRHDHGHAQALRILTANGSAQDHKRVTQAQARARYALRRAG